MRGTTADERRHRVELGSAVATHLVHVMVDAGWGRQAGFCAHLKLRQECEFRLTVEAGVYVACSIDGEGELLVGSLEGFMCCWPEALTKLGLPLIRAPAFAHKSTLFKAVSERIELFPVHTK